MQRYLDVLEAVFLIARVPAWSPNLTQRKIRAPTVFITDPGLASHLRDLDIGPALRPELAAGSDGPVIEGFVAMEVDLASCCTPGRRRTSW